MRPLTSNEARVLGTLMEKARTVPDSYPLTLNAVLSGCNQKTSREPLMNLAEAQARQALDELRQLSLVFETSGGRVARWEHNLQRVLSVPEQSAVLLGLLMLRGPQTAGELRINAERWYRFADISSVEGFLQELHDRAADKGGPLVARLARLPGAREQRWTHLLCGAVQSVAPDDNTPLAADASSPELRLRVDALEAEVSTLRLELDQLRDALGMSPPAHTG